MAVTATDSFTTSSTTESTDPPSTATSDPIVPSSTLADATSISSSKSSGTPVGAIVGGVVGGVAVIGLTILGVFFIKKYQKNAHIITLPPPTLSEPQEFSGSGVSSVYSSPSQNNYAPGPQYNTLGQLKYQSSVAQTPLVAEAPNTPAIGTGQNRAELG
ncbi:hypothetical protein K445DRAFT_12900 [Daldinia sp. EC12]|nr:hypothetical protein K445DRAFT_12900 [Daldinia sp. EC12]